MTTDYFPSFSLLDRPLPLPAPGDIAAHALETAVLTVDDFADGYGGLVYPQTPVPLVPGFIELRLPASVPGGRRYLALTPDLSTRNEALVRVQRGRLHAASHRDQRLYVTLGYGLNTPMALNLSACRALRLHGLWRNEAFGLTVYANTTHADGSNPHGSVGQWLVPAGGPAATNFDLPLGDFFANSASGQPVDWLMVNQLMLVISPASGHACTKISLAALRGMR